MACIPALLLPPSASALHAWHKRSSSQALLPNSPVAHAPDGPLPHAPTQLSETADIVLLQVSLQNRLSLPCLSECHSQFRVRERELRLLLQCSFHPQGEL